MLIVQPERCEESPGRPVRFRTEVGCRSERKADYIGNVLGISRDICRTIITELLDSLGEFLDGPEAGLDCVHRQVPDDVPIDGARCSNVAADSPVSAVHAQSLSAPLLVPAGNLE